jgi:hypothetical protein
VSSVEVTEPVITEEAQGSKEKADEVPENTIGSDEKVEDLPEIEEYVSEQDIIRKIMAACKGFDFPTINKYIDKIRYEKLDIMKTEIYLSICEMSDNMMNEELYNLLKDYLKDTYGEEAETETPVGEGPQHLQNE